MARILVIDDEPVSRKTLAAMLRAGGHEVGEADDGQAGVDQQRATPFDLVITDIYMPGQEGLETVRMLRREFPALRIVAVSGGGAHGNYQPLEWAMSLGADRAILKPFGQAEILALVADLLPAAP